MVSELFVLWTPGAVGAALVGGLVLGLVTSVFDEERYTLRETFMLTMVTGAILFGVFYAGQIYDVFVQSGVETALRATSRLLLALLYSGAIGAGAVVGLAHKRRGRRVEIRRRKNLTEDDGPA